MTSRRCPASTTSPGRASTSITRPVTGACTRASASSLNCALPLVSSDVAHALRLGQVRVAQQQHLLAQGVGAVDLGARSRDLALVTVEDAQRDAHAHAEGVVAADPL